MRRADCALVVGMSCALSAIASGQIWSQPVQLGGNPTWSNRVSTTFSNQAADNFQVASAATLTDVRWWGQTQDPGSPFAGQGELNLAGFNVRIFADTGGGLPGALVADRFVAIGSGLLDKTIVGPHPSFGGSVTQFDCMLDPPVALPAGGIYWLSITGELANTAQQTFTWQSAVSAPNLSGTANRTNDAASWGAGSAGVDHSFELFGSFFVDSDGDGLSDSEEVALGTNPASADTDGDGLSDGAEVNIHFTNPVAADTDADALGDGEEVNVRFTNPLVADTDSDGLLDGTEVSLQGVHGCLNPLASDSEGDNLSDGFELLTLGTNPCLADTDGDGLPDDMDPVPYIYLIVDEVLDLDPALFDAPNPNAAKGKRGALANQFGSVLLHIENERYSKALEKLADLTVKIDEWLIDCEQRDELQQYAADLAVMINDLI